MSSINFKRNDVIIINGQEYVYWGEGSVHRGTHYVYIDVSFNELSHADQRKYKDKRYFYTQAMNRPYYEVPEYVLQPRTNRQAAMFLTKEE